MSAHVIQARPKAAERAGRGPLPTTRAAAGKVGPDPVIGLHPTPEPDPATSLDPFIERSPEASSQPQWRALLEARWQARLRQITELSLAYHDAAATGAHQSGDRAAAAKLRDILRRTVATRRALADIEEALARLPAGRFGRCEQCDDAIPATSLALTPEARYCPKCAAPRR
jgi:DnaK suppressor protein